MSENDLELYETELACVFLPCHGLTDQIPYYVKTSKEKPLITSKKVKGFPLNLFSITNEKIAVIKFYGKEEKSIEYSIWIKLNRLIYIARMILWPNVKRRMTKELI
jgi:hypothetical protein